MIFGEIELLMDLGIRLKNSDNVGDDTVRALDGQLHIALDGHIDNGGLRRRSVEW